MIALLLSGLPAQAGPYRSVIVRDDLPQFTLAVPKGRAMTILSFTHETNGVPNVSPARLVVTYDVPAPGGSGTLAVPSTVRFSVDVSLKDAVDVTRDVVITGPASVRVEAPTNSLPAFLSYKLQAN